MQATHITLSITCSVLLSLFLLCLNRTTLKAWVYRVFSHANWPIKTRHFHWLCSKQKHFILQQSIRRSTSVNNTLQRTFKQFWTYADNNRKQQGKQDVGPSKVFHVARKPLQHIDVFYSRHKSRSWSHALNQLQCPVICTLVQHSILPVFPTVRKCCILVSALTYWAIICELSYGSICYKTYRYYKYSLKLLY